jgi:hypothetical protein
MLWSAPDKCRHPQFQVDAGIYHELLFVLVELEESMVVLPVNKQTKQTNENKQTKRTDSQIFSSSKFAEVLTLRENWDVPPRY